MEDPRIKLRNDEDYYGDYGKQWLSKSMIKTLYDDPKSFLTEKPDSKILLEGKYFHAMLLEPEKAADVPIIDVTTRNTKKYKDFVEENKVDVALLKSEADQLQRAVDNLRQNSYINELVYQADNAFEIPEIGTIFDHPFKGKADILSPTDVFDIKLTAQIDRFKWTAIDMRYDIQAFIYEELFGKPMTYITIDKKTYKIGIYKVTEEFVNSGKMKTLEALNVYDRFFSPDSIEDIKDHYEEIYL